MAIMILDRVKRCFGTYPQELPADDASNTLTQLSSINGSERSLALILPAWCISTRLAPAGLTETIHASLHQATTVPVHVQP